MDCLRVRIKGHAWSTRVLYPRRRGDFLATVPVRDMRIMGEKMRRRACAAHNGPLGSIESESATLMPSKR